MAQSSAGGDAVDAHRLTGAGHSCDGASAADLTGLFSKRVASRTTASRTGNRPLLPPVRSSRALNGARAGSMGSSRFFRPQ